MVRGELAGQPHDLHVDLAFALHPPGRPRTVEVAVDQDLEQDPRVIGRPPHVIWFDSVESKGDHVKTVGEGVNQPHRAVRGDILVQTLREKHRLLPVCPSLKSHFPSSV